MEDILLGAVGVVIQLIFRYAPKASDWYQAQSSKGLWMLAFVAIVSLGYWGLSCVPYDLGIKAVCNVEGFIELVNAFGSIAVANQLTYLFTPDPAVG